MEYKIRLLKSMPGVPNDYPVGTELFLSEDGKRWETSDKTLQVSVEAVQREQARELDPGTPPETPYGELVEI